MHTEGLLLAYGVFIDLIFFLARIYTMGDIGYTVHQIYIFLALSARWGASATLYTRSDISSGPVCTLGDCCLLIGFF